MLSIHKLFEKESVLKSMAIVFVFYVLLRVVGLVKGIVFARLLGPKEYGVYTLAFFAISIVVPLSIIGIPSSYDRYIPQYERKGMLRDFLKRTYSLTMITGIFATLLLILFSEQFSKLIYGSSEHKWIMILCGLTIPFYVLFRNLLSTFSGMRVFKMQSLLNFAQVSFFAVLGIALVVFYAHCAESAILGNLFSCIIVVSLLGFLLLKYLMNNDAENVKISELGFYSKVLKFSVWFTLTPLVMILFRYTDRWMLSRFVGLHDVGIYSVAGNITSLVFAIGMIVGNVLYPNLSIDWEDGEKDEVMGRINFATKVIVLLLLGCSVILVLFKQQIVFVLYGKKYMEGISIINIFLLFYLLNTIWWILGMTYPMLIEKPYLISISAVGGLVMNVFLNYKLIPLYGIMGAVIATAAAFGIILILLCVLNRWKKMTIELRTIFVCLFPLILLFNNLLMILTYLVLFLLTLITPLILTDKEKKFMKQKIVNLSKKIFLFCGR